MIYLNFGWTTLTQSILYNPFELNRFIIILSEAFPNQFNTIGILTQMNLFWNTDTSIALQ